MMGHVVMGLSLALSLATAPVSVLTQKYDNARTGWNAHETTLTPALLKERRFGRLFSREVDGQIYGQPLLVPELRVGSTTRAVVFVATTHNSVYAFDADDPAAGAALWHVNLGPSVPKSEVCRCNDIMPEVGITATPVIDPASATLYVTSKHVEAGRFSYRLSALDLTTGAHRRGSPVAIGGQVRGRGVGTRGGVIAFDPRRQHNRPGLLLQNGRVYIGFASHGDEGPYHGWVFAYDARTLERRALFNTTPGSWGGGIWMGGNGLVGDGRNLYFATGNGGTNPRGTPPDLSEAMVKLDADLKLADWQVRGNYAALDRADQDYGSGGPMLVPSERVLIMGGKDASVFVYDPARLGHYQADDGNTLQRFAPRGPRGWNGMHFGGFVLWERPGEKIVYGWPEASHLLGFRLRERKLIDGPVAVGPDLAPASYSSGMITGSSNGDRDGVIWASTTINQDPNERLVSGKLRAYDAATGALLWDSTRVLARDHVGTYASYAYPTVANGKVYQPSWTGSTRAANGGVLHVYGALPVADPPPAAPVAHRRDGDCAPFADMDAPPPLLSMTGCVDPADARRPARRLVPYTVASPLWSDGAAKERYFALPAGGKIHVTDCAHAPADCGTEMASMGPTLKPGGDGHWEFPVGTVLVKVFSLGDERARTRVETRLLVRYDDATWMGYSYEWDEKQADAKLIPDDRRRTTFTITENGARVARDWSFPSRQDCLQCHTSYAGYSLGPETRQLAVVENGANQLERIEALGVLDAPLRRPLPAPYAAPTAPGDATARARSYLHANCAHCHRPDGKFPRVDLRFTTPLADMHVCDAAPDKGDLGVPGARLLSPGNPARSLLSLRMRDLGAGRMPQLATYHVDEAGAEVVDAWIRSVAKCSP
jgi:outer membrane protein assembly factor BamB